ncbi:K+/H+ antiporter subunit F [Amaricoccus solimangrovi]|uniref:K+/H+ antiporter subunit F n=1 Tax=Amaricoccus solimangrovi TaxID=2589815 RepID=A0A501WLG9_9RHOB|nr:K+/H+ antiporter subunit F [Amaricoccus solimangrovi]TPE49250.1 K+/H+ antiporter subunit F [Amaricoccus solimangrovi]
MSGTILYYSVVGAQVALVAAMACAVIRMIIGPRAQDRVLAFDAASICTMLIFVTQGMRTGNVFFFEGALVISALAFVATVALAKFLMRGEVIE